MSDFDNNYLGNKSFIVRKLITKLDKEYEHVLNVWNKFETKTMKDFHDLHLRCDFFFLIDVFEKFKYKG